MNARTLHTSALIDDDRHTDDRPTDVRETAVLPSLPSSACPAASVLAVLSVVAMVVFLVLRRRRHSTSRGAELLQLPARGLDHLMHRVEQLAA